MIDHSNPRSEKQDNDRDDDHVELEEHKPLDIYSNISVTENSFGDPVFDVYEKVDMIDEGGTGEVWTVQRKQDDDGRLYAMKSIDKHFLFGTYMKELRNEIEVLRVIDHPNVVRILETYETKDWMYLIMERCAGGDLWSRPSYTERDVARILTQVLSAVALCHKHKVVHRDIKFENILFETKAPDSPVKVIDFGLSQKYRRPRGEYIMKLQVGTTYTIAPEVIEGEYDEKADVWSCGVVAYMLLSGGSRPFDAKEKSGIPEKIKEGRYTMEGPQWKDVSDEAKNFVRALLEYEAEKRWFAWECLESPWLSENCPDHQAPPKTMRRVRDALVHCDEEPQLKRIAKMIIAHCAPARKIQGLRQAFHEMDKSHDGTITHEEFVKALSKLDLPDEHLQELFSELDQNETGVINYTEFLSATLETQGEIGEDLLHDAFDKLDINNCGTISTDDISEVMDSKNLSSKPEVAAEEILAEVETKEEGKVTYDEFVEMFHEDS